MHNIVFGSKRMERENESIDVDPEGVGIIIGSYMILVDHWLAKRPLLI